MTKRRNLSTRRTLSFILTVRLLMQFLSLSTQLGMFLIWLFSYKRLLRKFLFYLVFLFFSCKLCSLVLEDRFVFWLHIAIDIYIYMYIISFCKYLYVWHIPEWCWSEENHVQRERERERSTLTHTRVFSECNVYPIMFAHNTDGNYLQEFTGNFELKPFFNLCSWTPYRCPCLGIFYLVFWGVFFCFLVLLMYCSLSVSTDSM